VTAAGDFQLFALYLENRSTFGIEWLWEKVQGKRI
jgi:hypothetical protein